jgi:hypothetical protein
MDDIADAIAQLRQTDPATAGLTDAQICQNAAIAYQRFYERDCLAKTWFMAEPTHPAVYRALKVDPVDPAAWYATAPFRLAKIDGAHVILAAWPAPKLLSDYPEDWSAIEDVLVWDPRAGTIATPEDVSPRLIGRFGATARLFGTAFAFFRAWVEERAAIFTQAQAARRAHWLSDPAENDAPGMLVVGDLKAIRLPVHAMPRDIECVGINPREVNSAIQRSAALPRATQSMKAAA